MQGLLPHLYSWLRVKGVLVLAAFAVFGLTFGLFNPWSMFFKADRELSYTEDLVVLACFKGIGCATRYELVIGNTGNQQLRDVTISIGGLPGSIKSGQISVQPLTGNDLDNYAAEVSVVTAGNDLNWTIATIKAGTLVAIELLDPMLEREAALNLRKLDRFAEIHASARINWGDPRLTVVGRLVEEVN